MVTALLLSTVPREVTELQCIVRTNQKFHHKFSVFECTKIAQNYAQVSLPLSHTIQYSYFDRKIYHLTLREGYCARFDDRSQSVLLWPSQKKTQWHRSRFSNAL